MDLIIILAIAAIGYIFYKNHKSKKEKESLTENQIFLTNLVIISRLHGEMSKPRLLAIINQMTRRGMKRDEIISEIRRIKVRYNFKETSFRINDIPTPYSREEMDALGAAMVGVALIDGNMTKAQKLYARTVYMEYGTSYSDADYSVLGYINAFTNSADFRKRNEELIKAAQNLDIEI